MGLVGSKYGSQCVIKLISLMHTWLPEGIKFSKLLRGSLILFWVDEEIFRDGLKCVTERTRGDNISCTKAAPRWPKLRHLTRDIPGIAAIPFVVKSEVGFAKAIAPTVGQLVSPNFPNKDSRAIVAPTVIEHFYTNHVLLIQSSQWKNHRRGFTISWIASKIFSRLKQFHCPSRGRFEL